MYHYFQDHRVFTYAFIHSEFNRIQDLSNHITNLFGINNFNLQLHDVYLLPNEDIRIIQPNDKIIVKPNDLNSPTTVIKQPEEVTEYTLKEMELKSTRTSINLEDTSPEHSNIVTKKKRKQSKHKSNIVKSRVQFYNELSSEKSLSEESIKEVHLSTEDLKQIQQNKEVVQEKLNKVFSLPENIIPTPEMHGKNDHKKKSNKSLPWREQRNEEMNCDIVHDSQEKADVRVVKTNNEKNEEPVNNITNNVVLHEKKGEIVIQNTDENVSGLNKNTDTYFNSVAQFSDESDINQMQNIAQTSRWDEQVYVISTTTKNIEKESQILSTNVVEEAHQQKYVAKNMYSTSKPSKYTGKGLTSSIAYLISSLTPDNTSQFTEGNAADDEVSKCNSVTHRKRIRKRKPKVKHPDTPTPCKIKEPEITERQFHSNSDTNIEKNNCASNSGKNVDNTFHNLAGRKSALIEEYIRSEANGINNNSNSLGKVQTFLGKKLTPEVINTLLVMRNMLPKVGDVILFQMLKLKCPQLSRYVIGEVVSFDGDKKLVQFKILEGLSELDKYEEKLQFGKMQIITLNWSSLIKPRLMSI